MTLRNSLFLVALASLSLLGCSSKSSCGTPYCPAVANGCAYEPTDACSCGPVVCADAATDAATDASSDGASADASTADAALDATDDATAGDASADAGASDAGHVDSGCAIPPCAPPPPGCHWETADRCSCGTLVCADAGVGASCVNNADCAAGSYCVLDSCAGVGSCQRRPEICPDLYMPVCGCDGVTYGNACDAGSAGASVAHTGPCDCREAGCHPGDSCQACLGADGVVYACIPAGAAC